MEIKQNKNTIMTDQKDIDMIRELLKIKNNLMNYIPMSEIIDDIRNIINDSEDIDFRSTLSRDYIDESRPEFMLKVTDPSKVYKVKEMNIRELDKYAESVYTLLNEQVISHISKKIRKALENDESFLKLLEDNDEDMVNLFLTNIYSVNASDPESNFISFRLIV